MKVLTAGHLQIWIMLEKPMNDSMFPVNIKSDHNVLAVCEYCGCVRLLPDDEDAKFPASGRWIGCPVCHQHRHFFKINPRFITVPSTPVETPTLENGGLGEGLMPSTRFQRAEIAAKNVYWRTCSMCGDVDRDSIAAALNAFAESEIESLESQFTQLQQEINEAREKSKKLMEKLKQYE